MERLEKFKDWLIPIDSVVYVEYRKSNKARLGLEDDDSAGTYVKVATGENGILSSIKIGNRNLLDEFKAWFDKFEDVLKMGDTGTWHFPMEDYAPKAVVVPLSDPPQYTGETIHCTETYKGKTYKAGGEECE